jgi:hypothetical protein
MTARARLEMAAAASASQETAAASARQETAAASVCPGDGSDCGEARLGNGERATGACVGGRSSPIAALPPAATVSSSLCSSLLLPFVLKLSSLCNRFSLLPVGVAAGWPPASVGEAEEGALHGVATKSSS